MAQEEQERTVAEAQSGGPFETTERQPIAPKRREPKKPPEDYWFVEVWYTFRPFFVMFLVHAAVFGLWIGSLDLAHRFLGPSAVDDETKVISNRLHLYSYYIVLAIFGLSFIIKSLFIVYEDLFGADEG